MAVQVRDNVQQQRFEVDVDGTVAGFTSYQLIDPQTAELTHTEVDAQFEGQGLGSQLIQRTLDDLRGRGVAVVPSCPFVRGYIAKHGEYVDLVPAALRGRYGLADSA